MNMTQRIYWLDSIVYRTLNRSDLAPERVKSLQEERRESLRIALSELNRRHRLTGADVEAFERRTVDLLAKAIRHEQV